MSFLDERWIYTDTGLRPPVVVASGCRAVRPAYLVVHVVPEGIGPSFVGLTLVVEAAEEK